MNFQNFRKFEIFENISEIFGILRCCGKMLLILSHRQNWKNWDSRGFFRICEDFWIFKDFFRTLPKIYGIFGLLRLTEYIENSGFFRLLGFFVAG
jgi:hypothetical protein